jgi:hypothetical protein
MYVPEEILGELEDRSTEIIQSEDWRKKKKKKNTTSETCGTKLTVQYIWK